MSIPMPINVITGSGFSKLSVGFCTLRHQTPDGRDHARLGEDGCQAHHHAKRGDPHGSGPGDQLADMTDDALLEDEAIDRLAEIFCAARSLALPLD
jgi:hypothetical protein